MVYVTAPHVVVDPKYTSEAHREAAEDPDAPEEAKAFGWWHANQVTPEGYFPGFKDSVGYLKDIMIKEASACLAAMLTEMLEDRSLAPDLLSSDFDHPAFKFAIVVAGFIPTSQTATQTILQGKIKTPSMHMFGENDTLVLPERMKALTTVFEDPLILAHPGGHVVPTNAANRNEIAAFVSKFTT
ncbi:Ovarian cancer-associated protein 2 [Apophysomyces sp. BC1015]|nr:Ovarian cancer-associated protein 2 [Apophysomyces sp. BC1015]